LFGDLRDRIPLAGRDHCFRRRFFPNPISAIVLVGAFLEIRPLIGPLVLAFSDFEFRRDPPVIARLEITDLELAFVNDRQRWRLHSTDGGDIARARTEHSFRDSARAVDPDEPIALAPRTGGIREA